jgi:DNA-binding CsgD family transcriptional regulator
VALLAARTGDISLAKSLLAEAIELGDGDIYPIDSALARLQLAELIVQTDPRPSRAAWDAMRRKAWRDLEAAGISPTEHAYRVTRALNYRRAVAVADLLTQRERDVLALLERGLTYREASAELGLSWRTIQSHAVSLYTKLGVHRRADALRRAQELGLLRRS